MIKKSEFPEYSMTFEDKKKLALAQTSLFGMALTLLYIAYRAKLAWRSSNAREYLGIAESESIIASLADIFYICSAGYSYHCFQRGIVEKNRQRRSRPLAA